MLMFLGSEDKLDPVRIQLGNNCSFPTTMFRLTPLDAPAPLLEDPRAVFLSIAGLVSSLILISKSPKKMCGLWKGMALLVESLSFQKVSFSFSFSSFSVRGRHQ